MCVSQKLGNVVKRLTTVKIRSGKKAAEIKAIVEILFYFNRLETSIEINKATSKELNDVIRNGFVKSFSLSYILEK